MIAIDSAFVKMVIVMMMMPKQHRQPNDTVPKRRLLIKL